MPADPDVRLEPISSEDIPRVARFLHEYLNDRLSAEDWGAAMVPPWLARAPNHGFMLTVSGEVVGANLAFYSERTIHGKRESLCNLGGLCIREDLRAQAFRLVRALLKQPGYNFTDLSPSGNVIELNKRLGFRSLDTATVLAPNLPWPATGKIKVIADLDEIERRLNGPDLQIFRDHRQARAAKHVLIVRPGEHCYVMFRRDRRKNLPLFASILYVGNKTLYSAATRHIGSHLLLRHRVPVTLVERRVVDARPWLAHTLAKPRPKMYKSQELTATDIDYLYSELTCVPW